MRQTDPGVAALTLHSRQSGAKGSGCHVCLFMTSFRTLIYPFFAFVFQNKQNVLAKQIDLRGKEPEKGVLMSHTIADLRIPLAYEVRLAPITTYSTGDYISRTIQYSERGFHIFILHSSSRRQKVCLCDL